MYLKKGSYPMLFLPSSASTSSARSEEVLGTETVRELSTPEPRPELLCTTLKHSLPSTSTSLLADVGVFREVQLTPKARKLYRRATGLLKTMRTLKSHRAKHPRKRLYEQFTKDEFLEHVTTPLPNSVATFIQCQITQSTRRRHGRRYSIDQKVLELVLPKQSGRAYKTIQKLFYLPSRKTLSTLLHHIPIGAGINDPIFDNLKAISASTYFFLHVNL
ncbi:uncharacterized protein LOC108914185 [Anoplophora glabripennis]|uniref:uncharacterized protein LOC108914185 n=1 Tax=Anoplophora glabripennis TaxID=217634 RepID=UPI0008740398|nr:uncharacterized protein LOC108914185 [Anoplophora glabripennis]XP_023311245.1 uncharacterized protein LOC111691938 [Anoplophora glabripennis]XP_023311246.1 uncharacterized protein LOC111691938 [Anoplophora glabripennis]XP_023311753.1 uncharacterized protein LOC108914185 [Anoplophora glabripennis]